MISFDCQFPTRFIFGENAEEKVGEIIKNYGVEKVLLLYGSASIKRTGLYDKVVASLNRSGIRFTELSGVVPNPRVELVREGIDICRRENIKMVLSVGGGSVIDTGKAISFGVPYSGDVWDFFSGKAAPKDPIMHGTIVTVAAAGSEGSNSCVITNAAGPYKVGCNCQENRPTFSIIDPELTKTLPHYTMACGIADVMSHSIERFFQKEQDTQLMEGMLVHLIKTVMEQGKKALDGDKNARAQLSWAAVWSHNGALETGSSHGDWTCHKMEHELSAFYDIPHGAGLAILTPNWWRHVCRNFPSRFIDFSRKILDINEPDEEKAMMLGADKLEAYFKSIGLPTKLSEVGINDDHIAEMAQRVTKSDTVFLGDMLPLHEKDVYAILSSAL